MNNTLTQPLPSPAEALLSSAWWCGLTVQERAAWLVKTHSANSMVAWTAFQKTDTALLRWI